MTVVLRRPPWMDPKIALPVVNETTVARALAAGMEWHRQIMCPNLFLFSWEMDLCVITKSRRVHEYEIKLSMSDWNADRNKQKWNPQRLSAGEGQRLRESRGKISRFSYVVTEDMAERIPPWVSEKFGIYVVPVDRRGKLGVREIRTPRKLGDYVLSDVELQRALTGVYFRYWRHVAPVDPLESSACTCARAEADLAGNAPATADLFDPES